MYTNLATVDQKGIMAGDSEINTWLSGPRHLRNQESRRYNSRPLYVLQILDLALHLRLHRQTAAHTEPAPSRRSELVKKWTATDRPRFLR